MAFLEGRAQSRSRSDPDKRDIESGPTCSQWSERHPRACWPIACGRRRAGEISLNLRAHGSGRNAHLVLQRRVVPATRKYCQSSHQRQGLRTAETNWKYGSGDGANEVGSAAKPGADSCGYSARVEGMQRTINLGFSRLVDLVGGWGQAAHGAGELRVGSDGRTQVGRSGRCRGGERCKMTDSRLCETTGWFPLDKRGWRSKGRGLSSSSF